MSEKKISIRLESWMRSGGSEYCYIIKSLTNAASITTSRGVKYKVGEGIPEAQIEDVCNDSRWETTITTPKD